jgi:hypothetical protein
MDRSRLHPRSMLVVLACECRRCTRRVGRATPGTAGQVRPTCVQPVYGRIRVLPTGPVEHRYERARPWTD